VANRLRTVEAKTGRPLASSAAEFEAALRLSEIGEPPAPSLRWPLLASPSTR